MPKNKQDLQYLLSGLKAWAVIAAIGAIIITGFYGYQGYRYWNAWNGERTMTNDMERITAKVAQGVPQIAATERNRAAQEEQLEGMRSSFFYSDIGNIMGTVSATAWNNGVELASLSGGEPIYEQVGNLEYEIQGLTVTAEAPTENLYQFVDQLSTRMPVMEVSEFTLGTPGEKATAQLQLAFYLSPRPITEEEGAD